MVEKLKISFKFYIKRKRLTCYVFKKRNSEEHVRGVPINICSVWGMEVGPGSLMDDPKSWSENK